MRGREKPLPRKGLGSSPGTTPVEADIPEYTPEKSVYDWYDSVIEQYPAEEEGTKYIQGWLLGKWINKCSPEPWYDVQIT